MDQSDQKKTSKSDVLESEKAAEKGDFAAEKLDPVGEAQVRSLAKSRARRSLSLQGQESSSSSKNSKPAAPALPVKKVGWVDVPGNFLLEWNANPWRVRPKKLALLALSYVSLFLFVLWVAPGDTALLIIVPFILLGSASSHLLPSKYIITEEGIYWRNYLNMMFKNWLDIEAFIFDNEMGELFFDTKSVRSRIQRGIPVYYDKNRNEIEELVRQMHTAKWDQLRDEVRQRSAARADAAAKEEKATKEGDHD